LLFSCEVVFVLPVKPATAFKNLARNSFKSLFYLVFLDKTIESIQDYRFSSLLEAILHHHFVYIIQISEAHLAQTVNFTD
jgi:hypothetical protein